MANAKALSDEARAKGVTVADAGAFEVPEDPAVVCQETGTPLYDVQLKEYVTSENYANLWAKVEATRPGSTEANLFRIVRDVLGDPPKGFLRPAVSKDDAKADAQAAPRAAPPAAEEAHPGPILEDATLPDGKGADFENDEEADDEHACRGQGSQI